MIFDILVGILFALIFYATGFIGDISLIWCLFLAIIFSVLPDMDVIHDIIKQGKVAAHAGNPRDHRDFIHHPILYLIIGNLIILYFGHESNINRIAWMTLFSILSLGHFIHDSFGTGWGVKWLSPFSQDSFRLCTDPKNGEYSKTTLVSRWTPENKKDLIIRYGRLDWADDEDGKVTSKSIFMIEKKATVITLIIIIVLSIYYF